VKVVPGTERAQASYPYHIQFSKPDDQKFWFYNSMHFPVTMSNADMGSGKCMEL
jgi:pyruvate,water dikinase